MANFFFNDRRNVVRKEALGEGRARFIARDALVGAPEIRSRSSITNLLRYHHNICKEKIKEVRSCKELDVVSLGLVGGK